MTENKSTEVVEDTTTSIIYSTNKAGEPVVYAVTSVGKDTEIIDVVER